MPTNFVTITVQDGSPRRAAAIANAFAHAIGASVDQTAIRQAAAHLIDVTGGTALGAVATYVTAPRTLQPS